MKWYIKFPIYYVVAVCIVLLSAWIFYRTMTLAGIFSIMLFMLFVIGAYSLNDYVNQSKKRIANASESEKAEIIAKDKKIQRIIILISLIVIIIAIALAYILTR